MNTTYPMRLMIAVNAAELAGFNSYAAALRQLLAAELGKAGLTAQSIAPFPLAA